MISNAFEFASYGIRENGERFSRAAARISNPDTMVGVAEIVEMKQAEHGMRANVAVLKVANEMSEHLVDIIA